MTPLKSLRPDVEKSSGPGSGWYLSYPVCTIHGLQVPHGVPVMFHKHHRIGACQVETQAPHVGGEQQHINGGVVVKPERQRKPGG